MTIEVRNLRDTFAVLKPDLLVETRAVSPSLYEQLDEHFSGFRNHVLISVHEFTEDWPSWERHPAGDEIVMLMSGRATIVLRVKGGEESIELQDKAAYIVVPRDTWHTTRISEPTRMLFITPGEGTENQAV